MSIPPGLEMQIPFFAEPLRITRIALRHNLADHRPISLTMAVESGGLTIWCFAHVGSTR
jgi:hypothetical protein